MRHAPVITILLFAVSFGARADSMDSGAYDDTRKSIVCVNSGLGICAVPIYALYSTDVRVW